MNNNDRPRVVLVNRCVIEDDGKILLVKRSAHDANNPGLWEVPGGKLDNGQNLLDALKREVAEETGLDVEPTSPLAYTVSFLITDGKYAGMPYVALFSLAKIVSGSVKISDEHEDFVWCSYGDCYNYELTNETREALEYIAKERSILNSQ